ncbi:MAG: GNAT family N-acetyltransferase [Actinomycetota bacterium]|jgi:diamine N-acetyltransferase
MILENDGIRLRAVEPEDLELLYRWENDEANWKLSNTLVPYSRYILKKYIAGSGRSIYETGQLRLMIEVLPDERTVGTIDLYDFDHFHNRAGVGILIADPADRKKGYASAALVCLTGYAFETIGLHQLWCNILENNSESLHLFTHHGFVICGTRKEWIRMGNGYETEINLQLINPKK